MTGDLFGAPDSDANEPADAPRAPLADRMRPRTLDDVVGQDDIVGPGTMLRQAVESARLPSIIFWGPPGSGKTTIARILATVTGSRFVAFSAVLSGVKEIRQIVETAQAHRARGGGRTILFVDEIHRFNKSQQDSFLPHVEAGVITLVGATTENPSFEVNAALLSRCRVLTLRPIDETSLRTIAEKALADPVDGLGADRWKIEDDAWTQLVGSADGDARRVLNTLEVVAGLRLREEDDARVVTAADVREALQTKSIVYDKTGEEHYNVISAFIKSLRGSDPDAALYYLARMVEAGEDAVFIARRMVVLASEDIGNADLRALPLAVATMQAVHMIGMPEARINLAQCATYLATAPKSNASYMGLEAAVAEVRESGALPVPLAVRNAPTRLMKDLGYHKGYRYDHDAPGHHAGQQFLPDDVADRRFYEPTGEGHEDAIRKRLEWLRSHKTKTKD